MDKGETFGNRTRNFSAIFLSNVTGSHDVFDCFSKRSRTDYDERTAGSDNEVRGNESLSALAWSQGLKVSRSWSHGLRVSSVVAQEEGTRSLLGTYRGSKKVQPM